MPHREITVRKMDGSEFKVKVKDVHLSMVRVSDLKRIIALREDISFDMFDLSSGDVVLQSPEQLKLSLRDAGILDTASMTMKKGKDYSPETDRWLCPRCRMPQRSYPGSPCRRCYGQHLAMSNKPLLRRLDPQMFVSDSESDYLDDRECESWSR